MPDDNIFFVCIRVMIIKRLEKKREEKEEKKIRLNVPGDPYALKVNVLFESIIKGRALYLFVFTFQLARQLHVL